MADDDLYSEHSTNASSSGVLSIVAATPPLEPVITGTPFDENAIKFGTSEFNFEIW